MVLLDCRDFGPSRAGKLRDAARSLLEVMPSFEKRHGN